MATTEDWVLAAFEVLRTQSVERVRVEALAKRLKVTKGSFYWHFTDRPALLAAVLAAWEARATSAIIEQVDARATSAIRRLDLLFSLIHRVDSAAGLESSIRAWAAGDRQARLVLRRVDARREAYVATLLEEAGASPYRARKHSHLLYLTLVGEFTSVATGSPATPWKDWRGLLRLMTPRAPRV